MPRRSGLHYRVKRQPVAQPLDKPYRFVALTQGQVAIIDAEDFEWISQRNWYARLNKSTKSFYAYGWKNGLPIAMHSEVLHCSNGQEIDHADHDTLNNRKYNLRKCTHAQNGKNQRKPFDNTSGFKGVFWRKDRGFWFSAIRCDGKFHYLGSFKNRDMAAHAYDAAAKEHFGEFASLNFPPESSQHLE